MLWYGRWVTSYKDGDFVQFILQNNGKIGLGVMRLPDGIFTENWYIETEHLKLAGKDVICVAPYEHWFKDNQDKMYDVVLSNYMRKEKQIGYTNTT